MTKWTLISVIAALAFGLSGSAIAQNSNDAMFEACQPPVTNAVKRELGAKQRVQLFYGDWKVEFINNAQERMRGNGQYETNKGFRQFTFECVWNIRNGNVSNVKVAAKKPAPQPGRPDNAQSDRAAFDACKPSVRDAVRRELRASGNVSFNDKAWQVEFVNMAESRVRGRGEYKSSRGSSKFSYTCLFNVRNGKTSDIRVVQR